MKTSIRATVIVLGALLAVGQPAALARPATLNQTAAAEPSRVGALGVPGESVVQWSEWRNVGANYTWSYGSHLTTTSSATKTYLHDVASTDRVNGKWADNNGPYVGVNYVRGNAIGSSWGTPFRLNSKEQHGDGGAVAASGKFVYTTWYRITKWINYNPDAPRTLYFRRNTSHGAADSWKARLALTSTSGRVGSPSVAAAGTYVYVAYTDANTGSIRVARSSDRGVTWTKSTIGSTTFETFQGFEGEPSISAVGSNVVVSWIGDASFAVVARVSTNNGADWDTETVLAESSNGSNATAARDDRLGVAWTTDSGASVSLWATGTWGAATTAGPPAGNGRTYSRDRQPALAFGEADLVGVAWTACWATCDGFESSTRDDLVWAESNDDGATWFAAQVVADGSESTYRINDAPSIVWRTADQRLVAWNGWHPTDGYYRMFLRAGVGTN